MANYYDPVNMARVASRVSKKTDEFHAAAAEIESLITQLSISWNDVVNQQFSKNYLENGAETAKKLEAIMKDYASALNQCSYKYGTAIDTGNTFLTSF